MSVVRIQQKLPNIMFFIISSLIAYQAASLSWLFLPADEDDLVWNRPAVSQKINTSSSNNNIASENIFGLAEKETAAPQKEISKDVKNAPRTHLDLTLMGIVSASDPAYSSAIITYRGSQGSYFVNSKIDGTSATVVSIFSDRLILDVNGTKQTLMLDDKDFSKPIQRATVRPKKESHTRKIVKLDRKAILSNPSKLTDYIRISPVRKEGEILGYRVRPGRDRSVFDAAGLKSGDIAVELNGVDLTDMQQALTLMKAFSTMTDLSLTVNRDGQLHELYFSIPQ